MNDINKVSIMNRMVDGNPSGGFVLGTGIDIRWQEGPIGRGSDRLQPNGAFVETVISACKIRIEFYQEAANGKFACQENAEAIRHLEAALKVLDERTRAREVRGVEGTNVA